MKKVSAKITLVKKAFSLLLIFALLISSAYAADLNTEVGKSAKFMLGTVKSPNVASIGGEWAVIALARSGEDIPQSFFDTYYQNLVKKLTENNGILHDRKYTEYSRAILAATAIGKDAQDISGYNLVTHLTDFDNTVWQGINGAIWALIALDCGNYVPENTDLRNKYIEAILSAQNSDGGWSLGETENSDTDLTAMALTALAKYKNDQNVKNAINTAIEFLSAAQNENGGFATYGAETSESAAQVIIALSSLGISQDDNRFVKNGNTAFDNLMTFSDGNGGFYHDTDKSGSNEMASEQAFCALVSLKRLNENLSAIYDMTDTAKTSDPTENIGLAGKNPDIKVPDFSEDKTFDDIIGNGAQKEIEYLAARKIINGKTSDTFEPKSHVTRAEFAALITRALGLSKAEKTYKFADVSENDWFYNSVLVCVNYGLAKGISDTEFNPNGLITNEETAVMLSRAAKICGLENNLSNENIRDILAVYDDYTSASEWAESSLAFCYENGIFDDGDEFINPQKFTPRDKIAFGIYNLLKIAKLI